MTILQIQISEEDRKKKKTPEFTNYLRKLPRKAGGLGLITKST